MVERHNPERENRLPAKTEGFKRRDAGKKKKEALG